ncbi:MAG: 3-phosphoshikimate 1-carboxyvinyltransferase [Clostridiales bacterium]|nr:3-phosphoshikimate 1-carboxyvinyltransferase [Clostridiales bacterium]
MDVAVSIKNLGGEIDAIASKSDVHRALIAAALGTDDCRLIMNTSSDDICATVNCLRALGAEIKKDGTDLIVSPIKSAPKNAVLDCGESGSTIRFLMPVAAALGVDSVFTGRGRLPERPQSCLLNALSVNGCKTSGDGEFPINISGCLQSGIFTLPGNVSSQYITGLLFALPILSGDSEIRLTSRLESRPYVDMTVSTLKMFGISVAEKNNTFYIGGNQKYVSPKEIKIDGDWSNSAFFVACGALGHMKINGLSFNSVQGDKVCVDIAERMGVKTTRGDDFAEIEKGTLHGTEINASDCPDLVPVLAALSCFAEGKTEITGAERLRIKESDRLSATAELIKAAGGDVSEMDDGLVIYGGKPLKSEFTVPSFNDHRLVMAAALLSRNSMVTIKDAQAVNKSYPSFFEDIKKVGGEYYVVNDR